MNVKNLKEMFERQASLKHQLKPKLVEKRQPLPINPQRTPEIDITTIAYSKNSDSEKINIPFLEELNKKITRNSEMTPHIINEQKLEVMRSGSSKQNQDYQGQIELRMEDIINGYESENQRDNKMRIRYGINERDANNSASNIFESQQIKNKEIEERYQRQEDSSFFQTLQKMLETLNSTKNVQTAHESTVKLRKTKIINKCNYDNLYDNKQSKLQRVDFLINIIFGSTQYESISSESTVSEKQQKNHNYAGPMIAEPSKVNIKGKIKEENIDSQKDIAIQEVHENKCFEPRENQKEGVIFQRPSMINNPFLSELSKKIKQKQDQQAKVQKIDVKINDPTPQLDRNRSLTPRQKKKPKNKQFFDDN